jgi:hypothetical protein
MVSPPARVGEGGAPQRSQTHPLRLTVRGVYLHFSNEKPNPAVKDWKVTTLQVSFLRCRGETPIAHANIGTSRWIRSNGIQTDRW